MSFSVALVGHPNVGKSTLMNLLTGTRQRVGNWPGVTVEKKTGSFVYQSNAIHVTDLPGIYSFDNASHSQALDEQIARQFIQQTPPDLIVNVLDVSMLERHLYLTTQLLESGIPTILVLNKADLLKKTGQHVEAHEVEKKLGCPVIALSNHNPKNTTLLKKVITQTLIQPHKEITSPLHFPPVVETALSTLQKNYPDICKKRNRAIECLTHQEQTSKGCSDFQKMQQHLQKTIKEKIDDADIVIAASRYDFCHQVAHESLKKSSQSTRKVDLYLDRLFLNRWLGIPLFLAMMYALFFFSINVGGAFQDFFEQVSDTFFVEGLARMLYQLHAPAWLIAILAGGAGKGVTTTLSFIPVLATMFFGLSILESSGYMSRAAIVVDRLMRLIGLSGKAFIPLIVGFGCNVPSIMATRTLASEKQRILTIMMAPFMSCNARLAIYSVFVATFFPVGGQNVIFALYLIGILMAVFTAWLLRRHVIKEMSPENITELPIYQRPLFSILTKQTCSRLNSFLKRASLVIIPVSAIVGLLNSFTIEGSLTLNDINQHSLLSMIGQFLTPIFSPIGITQDNWPATVGLLTGILAKEVVIGTLNTLYAQVDQLVYGAQFHIDVWSNIKAACLTIPENLSHLKAAFKQPLLASLPDAHLSQSARHMMQQRFGGQAAAFSYLLFILLYIPCVSTFAAIAKELNHKWAILSALWGTAMAYLLATLFYQLATFSNHMTYSLIFLIGIIVFFVVLITYSYPQKQTRELS